MAHYFKFSFNCSEYEARATWRNTRNGFAHDIVVRDANYNDVCTATMHYLNRTWECYEYESVLHEAIDKLTEEAIANEIYNFKEAAHISRLPKGAREQISAKWREEYDKAIKSIKRL